MKTSCHLAIGSAYGFNVEGGTEMTTEEKLPVVLMIQMSMLTS